MKNYPAGEELNIHVTYGARDLTFGSWVKVFRIIPDFRILICRKSAPKCLSRKIKIASLNYLNTTWKFLNIFLWQHASFKI